MADREEEEEDALHPHLLTDPLPVDMDSLQLFLDQFQSRSEAETTWLKEIFTFITQQVCPVLTGPAPPATDESLTGQSSNQLQVRGQMLQDNMAITHTLPVSYRPVSVSELVSWQHLACVSHLSWSTNQQRAWAREAELSLPGHKALPRVSLLLIGCLREGRGGEWRLTDASGSVRCECLSPSPQWLDRPVLPPAGRRRNAACR
ncbi:CST complex subunit CTC1-like protein [Lates japonicus]|uniref:CST complex subunit CTC1-like protein n=1 Tax=Lates japonicus TaxID=270547 RepID=A0AAD3NNR5_LATJO|nr:CST complex subunit CTC1-like protein [Lates japonicus]